MIRRFDEQGAFPDRTRGSYVFEKDEYISLSEEFRGLIDFYRKHETERGKKETTVYHEAVNAVSFLCHLKDRGLTRLEDVAENDVVSFFLSENGEQLRGCSYKKIFLQSSRQAYIGRRRPAIKSCFSFRHFARPERPYNT